jgi:RNA polymerase sigma-70 factor (ECF subfamily)
VTALADTADADADALFASHADPDRFAVLFDRHHATIRRYAASRLGGEPADDVAAETFLVAFRTRGRFRTRAGGSVRAWLFGIATNLIRRQHRDEERRYRALAKLPVDTPPDAGDAAVDRAAAALMRPVLARALAALPTRDRDVLLLVAVAGLNYAEISAALGVPPGTVGSRLNRARRSVRKALGDGGEF